MIFPAVELRAARRFFNGVINRRLPRISAAKRNSQSDGLAEAEPYGSWPADGELKLTAWSFYVRPSGQPEAGLSQALGPASTEWNLAFGLLLKTKDQIGFVS